MQFSKSLQGSKCAITMHPVSIESSCYFFLNRTFLARASKTESPRAREHKGHVIWQNLFYLNVKYCLFNSTEIFEV